MADITKCRGDNCPLKEQCYRHTTIEGILQSYFTESPFEQLGDEIKCEYYWNNKIYKELNDNSTGN